MSLHLGLHRYFRSIVDQKRLALKALIGWGSFEKSERNNTLGFVQPRSTVSETVFPQESITRRQVMLFNFDQ
jgi:hypothetical protein